MQLEFIDLLLELEFFGLLKLLLLLLFELVQFNAHLGFKSLPPFRLSLFLSQNGLLQIALVLQGCCQHALDLLRVLDHELRLQVVHAAERCRQRIQNMPQRSHFCEWVYLVLRVRICCFVGSGHELLLEVLLVLKASRLFYQKRRLLRKLGLLPGVHWLNFIGADSI